MKLEIELVPSTAWYSNLRTKISRQEWDRIRFKVYNDYNNCCAICGAKSQLNCHEIWKYNDDNHIQTLKGFIALCEDCHMIKHIGFAEIQESKGLLDMHKLIDHFLKVNEVDINIFEKHKSEAFKVWAERSRYEWKTEFGGWKGLIK